MGAKMDRLRMPYIGLKAMVLPEGFAGIIIDETHNMFTIKDEKGKNKMVMKKTHSFELDAGNQKVIIDGNMICFRPKERIKQKFRQEKR